MPEIQINEFFIAENNNQAIANTIARYQKIQIKNPLNMLIKDINKNHVEIPAFATIDELVQIHKLPQLYKFKYPKVLCGIEVEVENVLGIDPNTTLVWWKVENDGSLRNNGKEFKTVPLPVTYVEPALTQLFRGLNETVDFSSRTSIHVHIDVRNLTVKQLISMLLIYTTVENLLFKFASAQRKQSNYCVPLVESNLITAANSWETFAEIIVQKHNIMWHKYSALNILPVMSLGTVEFRQMPGMNNIRKLLVWIDLLTRLKMFAYRTPPDEVAKMIQELNTNSQYQRFLEIVFEDAAVYLDLTNLQGDMERPVEVVKSCTALNEYHQHIVSSSNPKSILVKVLDIKNSISKLTEKQLLLLKTLIEIYSWDEHISYDNNTVYEYIKQHKAKFRSTIEEGEHRNWYDSVFPITSKKAEV